MLIYNIMPIYQVGILHFSEYFKNNEVINSLF
jgi:hypothetical protein